MPTYFTWNTKKKFETMARWENWFRYLLLFIVLAALHCVRNFSFILKQIKVREIVYYLRHCLLLFGKWKLNCSYCTIVLLLTYHSKNSWPKNYLQSPALGLVLPWRKCLRFERMMLYIFLNCRSSRPFRGSSLKSSSLRLASWLLVLVMRDKKYVIEGLVSCPQWRIVTLRAL